MHIPVEVSANFFNVISTQTNIEFHYKTNYKQLSLHDIWKKMKKASSQKNTTRKAAHET